MKRAVVLCSCTLVIMILLSTFLKEVYAEAERRYVGSSKCKECHGDIYDAFSKFTRKAHSFSSIQKMSEQLTEEEITKCYACHTTGYGKAGGFVSLKESPDLANAGCETCHGPASEHVESGGDSSLIVGKGKISAGQICETCHNPQRVESFGYRPMIHAGAH